MSSDSASRAAGYAAATETLRSATRWLLTAAAGGGLALVAGLQLTNVGSLSVADWPRLVATGAGLVTALTAAGYMIWRTSQLLTNKWITLAQLYLERFEHRLRNSPRNRDKRLGEALDRIYDDLQVYKDELYGDVADSVSELYLELQKVNATARTHPLFVRGRRLTALRDAVNTVVQAANYFYTRENFDALRIQFARSTAAFAVGVVVFAYASNPPKPGPAPKAGQQTVHATPATFSSARVRGTTWRQNTYEVMPSPTTH